MVSSKTNHNGMQKKKKLFKFTHPTDKLEFILRGKYLPVQTVNKWNVNKKFFFLTTSMVPWKWGREGYDTHPFSGLIYNRISRCILDARHCYLMVSSRCTIQHSLSGINSWSPSLLTSHDIQKHSLSGLNF